jgi:pyruvate dehydrogenase E2 component (dihydrolipoamide acetyltransferase)
MDVLVPDIGDFKDVPVIEVLVKPGDKVEAEAPLITLESDKATMDVPSPAAGVVKEVRVQKGDKVSQGTLIATLEAATPAKGAQAGTQAAKLAAGEKASAPDTQAPPAAGKRAPPAQPPATPRREYGGPTETIPPPAAGAPSVAPPIDEASFQKAHAGPGCAPSRASSASTWGASRAADRSRASSGKTCRRS